MKGSTDLVVGCEVGGGEVGGGEVGVPVVETEITVAREKLAASREIGINIFYLRCV